MEETEDNSEVAGSKGGAHASDYEYLLSMAIRTLTLEKVQKLCADRDKLKREVDDLRKATPMSLWTKDLQALESQLDEQDKSDAQAEAARKDLRSRAMKEDGPKPIRQAPKNPRKYNKKVSNAEPTAEPMEISASSALETSDVMEVAKQEGKAGPKKAPAKKRDDDDEVLELKDRLAAYNFGSSPDHSDAMESKVQKREPSRRAATKKQPLSSVTEISDDDQIETSDDEDFDVEVETAAKEKGRKKPANAKAAKPPAATKRRGQANINSHLAGQKLITEVIKPAENSEISPAKKVRRMRPLPFNKKSGSVLGRLSQEENNKILPESEEQESPASASGSTEEIAQVVAPRTRTILVFELKIVSDMGASICFCVLFSSLVA